MDDAISRSSYSSVIERTLDDLSRILRAESERKALPLASLRETVARLDLGSPPEVEQGTAPPPALRRVTAPERWVPLPRRTTHGGRFGPAVAAKLRAEALNR